MSPKERRRIAQRAIKRDPLRPRTHTGRLLHPAATMATASGGQAFDAEHVELDAHGRVIALLEIDMFEGPPGRRRDPDSSPDFGGRTVLKFR